MALKKLCICGKVIDTNIRYCDSCQKLKNKQKKQQHKEYDIKRKDSKEWKFYKSKEWDLLRQLVKQRDNGLCKLCLDSGLIKMYDVTHHIEPIMDNWHRRLDINNCICLCDSCHEKVHSMYENEKNKNKIQTKLFSLICKLQQTEDI